MSGLDNVKALLAAASDATFEDTIKAITETKEFQQKSVGVNACLVCFCLEQPNGCDLATRLIDLLFQSGSIDLGKSALEFMLLWIRGSGPAELERQIEILETHAGAIKAIVDSDKAFTLHQLIISMLVSRCSSHVVTEGQVVGEPLPSKEFLEACTSRTFQANTLRGRLQIVTSRIFDENKPKAEKVVVESSGDDPVIVAALKMIASGSAGPLQFKVITDYLKNEKLKCVQMCNRVSRTPARVLTSLENIQNLDIPQDCDVCLQIALMCLIVSKENEQEFVDLVKHFAKQCHIDGDLVVDAVKTAKQPSDRAAQVVTPDVDMTAEADDARNAEPILKPFDLDPEPEIATIQHPLSPEQVRKQIEDFAGSDPSKWFDGDELNEWRVARLCVSHFMNKLDPNSFNISNFDTE